MKKEYDKKQRNYHMTLTYMYGIMVAFELTMATVVAWGHNKGLNFRKAVTDSEATGTGNDGKGGGGAGRKR